MSHNVSRAAVLSRIATVEGGEVVTQMVREVVENVQFRADMQDSKLRTHLTLSPDAPIDGTLQSIDPLNIAAGYTPVSTSTGGVMQDVPQVEELLKNPAQVTTVRTSDRYLVTTDTYTTRGEPCNAKYDDSTGPLPEAHITIAHNGQMLYGRIPLATTPDEATPAPMVINTGVAYDAVETILTNSWSGAGGTFVGFNGAGNNNLVQYLVDLATAINQHAAIIQQQGLLRTYTGPVIAWGAES